MMCFHLWQAVAVTHHRWVPRWFVEKFGPSAITEGQDNETTVLYRCAKCRISKTATLEGRWTLEQLNGGAR